MDILLLGKVGKLSTKGEPLRGISFREEVPAKRMTSWGFGEELRARAYDLSINGNEFTYMMKDCYSVRNKFMYWGKSMKNWEMSKEIVSENIDTDEFLSHKPTILCISPNEDWDIRRLEVVIDGKHICEGSFSCNVAGFTNK